MESFAVSIGAKIKACREAMGKELTQDVFGKAMGADKQTVSNWERGVHSPPVDVIVRIAAYFNRPISYFVDEEQPVNDWVPRTKLDVIGVVLKMSESDASALLRTLRSPGLKINRNNGKNNPSSSG